MFKKPTQPRPNSSTPQYLIETFVNANDKENLPLFSTLTCITHTAVFKKEPCLFFGITLFWCWKEIEVFVKNNYSYKPPKYFQTLREVENHLYSCDISRIDTTLFSTGLRHI